jgi:hypothetical protein
MTTPSTTLVDHIIYAYPQHCQVQVHVQVLKELEGSQESPELQQRDLVESERHLQETSIGLIFVYCIAMELML